ncbi:ATP-grasp domain-containing protein [Micromonospora sp. DR5-3]|uniref:ATP-grasp domain-containing protein n=1 Tax=unclassified Micromonospora TaxID=2617518 RepID=UPI0011D78DFE|nr:MULTISPECIES: ATP-grasp domain-containing protein [unclassified Micromonospora]MCW3819962.1 ATP-grasp domain-containing protein [Micromonospora sp. DR5-3]TYC23147.1 ATP-grasp domain-containing protein [Micromonospora sp. MP36]
MHLDLGRDEMVVVGASLGSLQWFNQELPPGTVVLVEEPDVIRRRGLERIAAELPLVSRLVPAAYQTGLDVDALLAREPGLATARLVMPGLEYGVAATARLAERLGLPGPGVPAADVFTDKHRMRLLAGTAGLANPAYELVDDPARATEFARRHGGRCVLKPTRRSGSLGVQLIADPAEIAAAWATSATPQEPVDATADLPTEVLVEELLAGSEHSVELLVADGEPIFANVTDKRIVGGRFPVESGHTVPSALPEAEHQTLRDAAVRLARAADFRSGMLHSEWILVDGAPTLVECAARMPGDMITALVSIAYECGFIEAYLRVLRGERPALPARPSGAAAVEFLVAPPGRVTAVDGVKAALRLPGVLDVQVDVAVGDTVPELLSSAQRSGHLLAWGTDPTGAESAARKAADQVHITVA